jgi:hypothetical protein
MEAVVMKYCGNISRYQLDDQGRLLTLQFIGSLLMRYSGGEALPLGPIIRTGLLLSARLGEFQVAQAYLARSLSFTDEDSANDLLTTLAQVRDYIADREGAWQFSTKKHQELFDVLVDTQDGTTFGELSFRALIIGCLEGQIPCAARQACDLVKLYADLLASIGATRLLWSERPLLAPLVQAAVVKEGADLSLYKQVETGLEDALNASLAVGGDPGEPAYKTCTPEQNLQAEFQRIVSHEESDADSDQRAKSS